MIINKHGSFYLRNDWGTKIIQAVSTDNYIFSPNNEQKAIDIIGLGRVMIKALRYWGTVMGLTNEMKTQDGISQVPTELFNLIKEYDLYFQKKGSLLLTHRNIAIDLENATAWSWAFNELTNQIFGKEDFVSGLQAYLAVHEMKVRKEAVEKEFNCFKNTYVGEKKLKLGDIINDDIRPFFAPLHILKYNEDKKLEKVKLSKKDIPLDILIYSIALDNIEESTNHKQVEIDKIMEEKMQIGRYYNIKYYDLLEMLLEAENKQLISLNNNFGNKYIEFLNIDYNMLVTRYFRSGDR